MHVNPKQCGECLRGIPGASQSIAGAEAGGNGVVLDPVNIQRAPADMARRVCDCGLHRRRRRKDVDGGAGR